MKLKVGDKIMYADNLCEVTSINEYYATLQALNIAESPKNRVKYIVATYKMDMIPIDFTKDIRKNDKK